MTATAWGFLGDLKRICLVFRRHAASVAARAVSHDRGTIMRQILGSSLTAVTLQSRMRLRRSSPHLSADPVGGLKVAEGAASTDSLGMYLICGYMGVGA